CLPSAVQSRRSLFRMEKGVKLKQICEPDSERCEYSCGPGKATAGKLRTDCWIKISFLEQLYDDTPNSILLIG
ncbi:hypothetical protein EJB05_40099, partial [Eragrostis curvula]